MEEYLYLQLFIPVLSLFNSHNFPLSRSNQHPSFPSSFQMPNLREKSILLVKMMTYIEKRFPDELELNAQFLDLVNYVYR